MDRLEKYINYIVDDLVKDTKIDDKYVHFPFRVASDIYPLFRGIKDSVVKELFSNYVIRRYGTHEEEIDIIFKRLKRKINSITKKQRDT